MNHRLSKHPLRASRRRVMNQARERLEGPLGRDGEHPLP